MKTTNKFTAFPAVLILFIISISCSDQTFDPKTNSGIPEMSGGIVDMGIVSGDVHQMSLSLSAVEITPANKAAAIPPVTSSVHIELYTNTDGIINNGSYTYSTSVDIRPFTFQSGAIYFSPVSDNFNAYIITGGTLAVVRTGISYYITLDVKVANGDSYTGHFTGNLSYMDTIVNY